MAAAVFDKPKNSMSCAAHQKLWEDSIPYSERHVLWQHVKTLSPAQLAPACCLFATSKSLACLSTTARAHRLGRVVGVLLLRRGSKQQLTQLEHRLRDCEVAQFRWWAWASTYRRCKVCTFSHAMSALCTYSVDPCILTSIVSHCICQLCSLHALSALFACIVHPSILTYSFASRRIFQLYSL